MQFSCQSREAQQLHQGAVLCPPDCTIFRVPHGELQSKFGKEWIDREPGASHTAPSVRW
jgi:hypothetical protein